MHDILNNSWVLLYIALFFMLLSVFLFFICIRLFKKKNSQKLKFQKKISKLQWRLKNAKQDLLNEKDAIQILQKHMVESIIILDDCDKIRLANDSAIKLLKINKNQMKTHSVFTLINDNDFLTALRESKKNSSVKKKLKIDGCYIRAYMNRVELAESYGTIILLVDITDSVKVEDIRREFTANVSHELKTPLTTIKGFGELFGSGMIVEPDKVIKYGSMIQRESERLLFLMNDIIRLSEIEEKTERNIQKVSLLTVTEDALQILNEKIEKSSIKIILPENDFIINGNENYIRELMINLIDNAVKYNNTGGSVKIAFIDKFDKIQISVSDNGIGIPENSIDRIFERFYRVDKSRSKERGGTGLGLSIVKHIVDYHKGTISIDSKLGEGTEIKICLPKSIE